MAKDIHTVYDNGMYKELLDLANELSPWFDIDKISWYSVYVWTKDDGDFGGQNVFDIFADYLQFYNSMKPWRLPVEALPVIQKTQEKMREIRRFLEDFTAEADQT